MTLHKIFTTNTNSSNSRYHISSPVKIECSAGGDNHQTFWWVAVSLRVAAYNRLFRFPLVQRCWCSFILWIVVIVTNCRIQLSCIRDTDELSLRSMRYSICHFRIRPLAISTRLLSYRTRFLEDDAWYPFVGFLKIPDHHWSTREEKATLCMLVMILFLLSLFQCDIPL